MALSNQQLQELSALRYKRDQQTITSAESNRLNELTRMQSQGQPSGQGSLSRDQATVTQDVQQLLPEIGTQVENYLEGFRRDPIAGLLGILSAPLNPAFPITGSTSDVGLSIFGRKPFEQTMQEVEQDRARRFTEEYDFQQTPTGVTFDESGNVISSLRPTYTGPSMEQIGPPKPEPQVPAMIEMGPPVPEGMGQTAPTQQSLLDVGPPAPTPEEQGPQTFRQRAKGLLSTIGDLMGVGEPDFRDRLVAGLGSLTINPNNPLTQQAMANMQARRDQQLQQQRIEGLMMIEALKNAQTPAPLSVAEEEVQKALGQEYAEWITGGKRQMETNVNYLKDAQERLADMTLASGPIVGWVPETFKSFLGGELAEGVQLRDSIRTVAQQSLRQILGAQFTQLEGTMFLDRVFNPRSQEPLNIQRIQQLLDVIEKTAADKNALAQWYEDNDGDLSGFTLNGENIMNNDVFGEYVLQQISNEMISKPEWMEDNVWDAMSFEQKAEYF